MQQKYSNQFLATEDKKIDEPRDNGKNAKWSMLSSIGENVTRCPCTTTGIPWKKFCGKSCSQAS